MKRTLLVVAFLCLPLIIGCDLYKDKPASFSSGIVSPGARFMDGRYQVSTKGSILYWETSEELGGHLGAVSLKGGEMEVADGQPRSGTLVVDMESLSNADLKDPSERQSLINEFKSDSYLSVSEYPVARFDITRIRPAESADKSGKNEAANYVIEGDLSLKGKTGSASFLAKIDPTEKGLAVSGTADAGVVKLEIELFLESLAADGV